MMIRSFAILTLITLQITLMGQEKTLQERLGYAKDAKLLIIHADDLGVSHSENAASIYAMENGSVNSASIMVPCPWFPEIADYARLHPEMDFGIHLTLTSEWKYLQWGPVAVREQFPSSLVDEKAFFYRSVADFAANADLEEVRRELRAQIDRALEFGVPLTHIDTHMGSMAASSELLDMYVALGFEYNLPVLIPIGGRSLSRAKVCNGLVHQMWINPIMVETLDII